MKCEICNKQTEELFSLKFTSVTTEKTTIKKLCAKCSSYLLEVEHKGLK